MRGVRNMVFALATSVLTMTCNGCAAVSPHEMVRGEAAVPPTLGMQMAMPSALGTGLMQPQPSVSTVHVRGKSPERFVGTPVDDASRIVSQFLVGQPADFEIAKKFIVPEVNGQAWTGNDALVAIAAERGRVGLSRAGGADDIIAAEVAISAPRALTGLNFDVGVAPRITVRDEGNLTTQRVGGEVRIGQNFDFVESSKKAIDGWYIFAGADGEALVWDTSAENGFTPQIGGMALTDQVTVGDLQAGVSIQKAGGELSLSYVRRDVEYSDRNGSISNTEDFAAITFTMRR